MIQSTFLTIRVVIKTGCTISWRIFNLYIQNPAANLGIQIVPVSSSSKISNKYISSYVTTILTRFSHLQAASMTSRPWSIRSSWSWRHDAQRVRGDQLPGHDIHPHTSHSYLAFVTVCLRSHRWVYMGTIEWMYKMTIHLGSSPNQEGMSSNVQISWSIYHGGYLLQHDLSTKTVGIGKFISVL